MQEEALWSGTVWWLSQRIPKCLRAQANRTTQELQARPDATDVRRTGRGQDYHAVDIMYTILPVWYLNVICINFSGAAKGNRQERIHEERGRSPPLNCCWPKTRDVRPIKSWFYHSQDAPKRAFLSSKIKTFSEEGHSPNPDPSSGEEGDTQFPRPTPSAPSAPRSSRLRHSTRLAPSALHLGAYGASALGASIRPLATLYGSTPGNREQLPKGATRRSKNLNVGAKWSALAFSHKMNP